jgi:hypothetical protein
MLFLVLNYVIKHCAIKAYGGVEVQLYHSTLDGGE